MARKKYHGYRGRERALKILATLFCAATEVPFFTRAKEHGRIRKSVGGGKGVVGHGGEGGWRDR